jgi:hypothetical protein
LSKNRKRKPQNINEQLLFKVLDEVLPGQYYIRNGYYSFLMSPKGRPMQYDIYYPDLKLAFEYQGKQHYHYSSYFFKDEKQFKYLQKCDRLKKKLSKELGITLIVIDYKKKITPEYIIKRIKLAKRHDVLGL